jgi:uncharacterized protein YlaI
MRKPKECEICNEVILYPSKARILRNGKQRVYVCQKCSLFVLDSKTIDNEITKYDLAKDPIEEIFKEFFKK